MSATSSRSRVACRPVPASARRPATPMCRIPGRVSTRISGSKPGRGDRPDRRGDVGTEAAGGDQDHPVGAVGELVGELHRHSPAEAVPDHGDRVDAQHGEQVTHAVGVAAEAVVGARLVREAVPEQVRRDDRVPAGQLPDHRLPRGVVAAEAVEEQQRRPGPGADEGPPVPVQGDVLDVEGGVGHSGDPITCSTEIGTKVLAFLGSEHPGGAVSLASEGVHALGAPRGGLRPAAPRGRHPEHGRDDADGVRQGAGSPICPPRTAPGWG